MGMQSTLDSKRAYLSLVPRILVMILTGLATAGASAVAYAILRYDDQFMEGLAQIMGSAAGLLIVFPFVIAFISRKMAMQSEISFLAVLAIAGNLLSSIGVFLLLFLFQRSGLF
jgi:hypothetical protein